MDRFIVIVVLMTWSGLAVAEKQAFACQSLNAAGLIWKNSGWQTTEFHVQQPFVLVMQGDTLTRESVARALGHNDPERTECQKTNEFGLISCADKTGRRLIFNPVNAHGGIATLYGATLSDSPRDTISVEAFTCQKF